jgi:hypothetical protein
LHDEYIMKLIVLGKYKPEELRVFNACRLYLQVELLSDILNAQGTKVKEHVWQGQRVNHSRYTTLWPKQPRPTNSCWHKWRCMLQKSLNLTGTGHFHNNESVGCTFGPLFRKPRNWRWFYDTESIRLFEFDNSTVFVRLPIQHTNLTRLNLRRFGNRLPFQGIPPPLIPVTIQTKHGHTIIDSLSEIWADQHIIPVDTWTESLAVVQTGVRRKLADALQMHQLMAVSDGSYKGHIATGAWILTTGHLHSTDYSSGHARSPGAPSDQDSHRGELTGLLGAMIDVQRLCKTFDITSGGVTMACDNDSALLYSFDMEYYPDVKLTMPDFDIIQAIRNTRVPNITYSWHKVKGHRDNEIAALDLWETLNTYMDKKAKMFREELESSINLPLNWSPRLPGDVWTISVKNHRLCKQIQYRIVDHISESNMSSYWEHIDRISTQGFPHVDWISLEKAMLRQTLGRRHWISKHACNLCGTNDTLVKWKQKQSALCSRCTEIETAAHVWRCHHSGADTIWDQFLQSLGRWLQETTSTVIAQLLIQSLQAWRDGSLHNATDRHVILQQQDVVGWNHVIEGCLCTAWRQAHQQYLCSIQSNHSSVNWTATLIQKLWGAAWQLWEHRNEIEHKHESIRIQATTDAQIAEEISKGFSGLDKFSNLFQDAELLHVSNPSTNITYKQEWLKRIHTARARLSRILQRSSCSQMRRNFRSYFGLHPPDI